MKDDTPSAGSDAERGQIPGPIQEFVELLPAPTALLTRDGAFSVANAAYWGLLGSEGSPKFLAALVHPGDLALAGHALLQARSLGQTSVEVHLREADGDQRTCRLDLRFDVATSLTTVIATDLTGERRRQIILRNQAQTDPLTGLANRAGLSSVLSETIRAKKAAGMVVVLFDLDRFKLINDTLGHQRGDDLLQVIARRLRRRLPFATIGRLGGDEFIVIVPSQPRANPQAIAESIGSAFTEPVQLETRLITVQASIGVVVADGSETATELIQQADIAAYEAKRRGRNQTIVADRQLLASVRGAIELEHDLRHALLNADFEPWFQPVVHVSSKRPTGFESLMRWRRADRDTVPAAHFYDVALEAGLLANMSDGVRAQSLHLAGQTDESLLFGINLSGDELLDGSTPAQLVKDCAAYGVTTQRIVVEITEQTLVADLESAAGALEHLMDAGFRVSLDDFGTGHSSLTYLTRLPLTTVKLDGSFVSAARHSARGRSNLAAIYEFVGRIGHEVVFEGIETEEDHELIVGIGGEFAQGFYYGHPAPLEHYLPEMRAVKMTSRV